MTTKRGSELIQWRGEGLMARLLLGYARRVPDHPAKIRIYSALAAYCFPNGLPVRSGAGVRLRVDVRDYIGHSICVDGAYEPRSLELAARLMMHGGTFVDVGCNFGLYSCSIATIPGSRVIAIDASPVALSKLQENLLRNQMTSVTMVSAALRSSRSVARLEAPPAGNFGAARISNEAGAANGGGCVVAALPLDEVLEFLRVQSIRLMKVDVEGSELEVLRGIDLGARYRPENIIMERSERAAASRRDLDHCHEELLLGGYQPHSVTGSAFRLGEVPLEENVWWIDSHAPSMKSRSGT